ncbi:hypothetical protein [Bradyrhizobium archetypum]|uniref:Uncharacterized protein n=1 Tax=Bradyrhizobium archetypum TaxID=2721160 RepID=A0A7Y4M0E7_9BRAD|nr:hypothetical protein [Bradyrhizobium archetypum]NOJ44790.1 hypothetical protein [Bradyrhizobium archetypum]
MATMSPSSAANDRGNDGPQSVAVDSTILHLPDCKVYLTFRLRPGPVVSGKSGAYRTASHQPKTFVVPHQSGCLRAALFSCRWLHLKTIKVVKVLAGFVQAWQEQANMDVPFPTEHGIFDGIEALYKRSTTSSFTKNPSLPRPSGPSSTHCASVSAIR